MEPRKEGQTRRTHRRCLYCGRLIRANNLQRHLDAHMRKWREAPRNSTPIAD